MARTVIPVKASVADGAAGVEVWSAGAVAADDSNNMLIFAPNGRVIFFVHTIAAEGVSITIVSIADPYSRTGDLGPTAVGASKDYIFGPFSPGLFVQNSGANIGNVHIDISGLTGTPDLQGLSF